MIHLAQVGSTVQAVGDNTTLLGAIMGVLLSGGLVAGYRFVVNFRRTERGMARARIREANSGERAAQHEASLWQARCGDLEYLLRQHLGHKMVPPLSDELKALVSDAGTIDRPEGADVAPGGEETGRGSA